MTNYEYVWGPVQKGWKLIDYRNSHLYSTLLVCAWIGMIGFLILGIFTIMMPSDPSVVGMLLCLGIWLACGISVIRIRRGRRRFLNIQQ